MNLGRKTFFVKEEVVEYFPCCCLEQASLKSLCTRVVSVPKRSLGVNGLTPSCHLLCSRKANFYVIHRR